MLTPTFAGLLDLAFRATRNGVGKSYVDCEPPAAIRRGACGAGVHAQGQAADAQLLNWLMEHQKEAGVFTTVSDLVEQLTDNPAAQLMAQEIRRRLERAREMA